MCGMRNFTSHIYANVVQESQFRAKQTVNYQKLGGMKTKEVQNNGYNRFTLRTLWYEYSSFLVQQAISQTRKCQCLHKRFQWIADNKACEFSVKEEPFDSASIITFRARTYFQGRETGTEGTTETDIYNSNRKNRLVLYGKTALYVSALHAAGLANHQPD